MRYVADSSILEFDATINSLLFSSPKRFSKIYKKMIKQKTIRDEIELCELQIESEERMLFDNENALKGYEVEIRKIKKEISDNRSYIALQRKIIEFLKELTV